MIKYAYVFNAEKSCFASAVFSSHKKAVQWIEQHALSGLLTEYPLNSGCYDWALAQGYFKQACAIDSSPIFIASFVSSYQKNWRFKHGVKLEKIYNFLKHAE